MKWKLLLSIGILSTVVSEPFLDFNAPFDLDVSKITCEEGNVTACILVGAKYTEGSEAIPRNYALAKKYMKKACDLGNKRACSAVGLIAIEVNKEVLSEACKNSKEKACTDLKKTYYLIDSKCSKCGSTHIAHYRYGLIKPDRKMQEKIDSGEIILAGCMISDKNPLYRCMDCGTDLFDLKQDK